MRSSLSGLLLREIARLRRIPGEMVERPGAPRSFEWIFHAPSIHARWCRVRNP